jgi:serine/threonine kinase 4
MHPVRAMFVIRNNPPKGLSDTSKWSTEFVSFVQSCLKVEVSERPSASQLLQNKFILMGSKEVGRLKKLANESLPDIEEYRKNK